MCLIVSGENNMFIAKRNIIVYKQLIKVHKGFATSCQHFTVELNSEIIPKGEAKLKRRDSKYSLEEGLIHAYTKVENPELGVYFEAIIKKGTKFWIQDDLEEIAAENLYLTDKRVYENRQTDFSDYLEYGVDVYLKHGERCRLTDPFNKNAVIGVHGYDDQVIALRHSKPLKLFIEDLPNDIRVIDAKDLKFLINKLKNDLNGYGNTRSLCSLGIKSPALDYCSKLGKDWYIPSSGELSRLFKNQLRINITLQCLGKPTLDFTWFWSSTLNSSENAWIYYSDGEFGLRDGFIQDYIDASHIVLPFLKLGV